MTPLRASTLCLVLFSAACSARGGGGGGGGFGADATAGDAPRVDAPPSDGGTAGDRGAPADALPGDALEPSCTPGASVCVDPQTAQVCNPDGRTTTTLPCGAAGGRCEGGRCAARLCAPGTLQCSDGVRRQCAGDGASFAPLPCPAVANGQSRCEGAGSCAAVCNSGYRDCNGVSADGCEASLLDAPANCGACGRVCPAGESCNGGSCVATCAQTLCSGSCVNVATNPAHCGGCDIGCSGYPNATGLCVAGACRLECAAGYQNCDGSLATGCETETRANPAHCGACGSVCAAGQSCVGGACTGGGGDAPRSCREARAARPTAASGVFRIDPDGAGTGVAFDAWCDMATAGGGWTLVAVITNADAQSWSPRSASWVSATTFGAPTSPLTNADAKSAAYNTLTADEVMITRMTATAVAVEVQTTVGCLRGRTLLSVMSQNSVYSSTCALSCGVVTQVTPFPATTNCHAPGLRFRCRDNYTATTANGFSISSDDNSFITSMSNTASCTADQSGFGASTGSTYADLDTDLASSILASDTTPRQLYVR